MATSWTIGASPDCDIIAALPSVSGRHCRLRFDGRGYTLEDLGSTNGTYVNGSRIAGPVAVTRADAITLGLAAPMPWPPEPAGSSAATVRIGRDPANDIVVDLPTVSGAHALVTWDGTRGGAVIEDLGSANGTAIGSPDRKITRAPLAATDTIYLGSHALAAIHALARLDPSLVPALPFRGDEVVIGRDPSCHLPLDLPMISGRHARLLRAGDRILIEDLGSANGTFVNAHRIAGPTPVRAGDLIGLGSHTVRLVVAPAPVPAAAPAQEWSFSDSGPALGSPILDEPAGPVLDATPAGSTLLDRPALIGGLAAQAPALGLAIGALSGGAPDAAALGLSLAATWFGLGNAIWVGRFGRLREWSARLLAAAGLGVVQVVVAWAIVAKLAGLHGAGGPSLLLLALASAAGLALGLLLVALAPRPAFAWGAAVAAMVPAWLLATRTGPIAGLLPSRWAFEGLLLQESPGLAERYFPAETLRMGGTADLMAIGFLLVGLSASAAYVIWASGPASAAGSRTVPGP
ncbi:FHA domain-containing protein [Tundrisphaera sp. TA3]|uniref:FHA domain-containing protein n=1 Tax=Tundrisphaera sp. TA3 TaxID=3435775 RepID=UPI003EB9DCB2